MKAISVMASMAMLATSTLMAQVPDLERSAVQAFEQASTSVAETQDQSQRDEAVKKFLAVLTELKEQGLTIKQFVDALSQRGLIAPGAMERLKSLVSDLREKDPDLLSRWSRGDVRAKELEALAEVLAGPTGAGYYVVTYYYYYWFAAFGCSYLIFFI